MRILLLILTCLLSAAGCRSDDPELRVIRTETDFRRDGSLSFLDAGGDTMATIDIEIAETDEARTRGLMGRRSLPPRSGMFFIMDEADTTGFWMRNTPMPLDIIFVGADSQVVRIARRTRPYSNDVISPEAAKKFVVEVRAGQADRLGITDSTRITWTRSLPPS